MAAVYLFFIADAPFHLSRISALSSHAQCRFMSFYVASWCETDFGLWYKKSATIFANYLHHSICMIFIQRFLISHPFFVFVFYKRLAKIFRFGIAKRQEGRFRALGVIFETPASRPFRRDAVPPPRRAAAWPSPSGILPWPARRAQSRAPAGRRAAAPRRSPRRADARRA